jgi:hypothetical protein
MSHKSFTLLFFLWLLLTFFIFFGGTPIRSRDYAIIVINALNEIFLGRVPGLPFLAHREHRWPTNHLLDIDGFRYLFILVDYLLLGFKKIHQFLGFDWFRHIAFRNVLEFLRYKAEMTFLFLDQLLLFFELVLIAIVQSTAQVFEILEAFIVLGSRLFLDAFPFLLFLLFGSEWWRAVILLFLF